MSHHHGLLLVNLSGSMSAGILVGENVCSLCFSLVYIEGVDQERECFLDRNTPIYISSSSIQTIKPVKSCDS